MLFAEDINSSLRTLKEGGVILYPTDTVWGLGCDATNSAAVKKIFRIKSRSNSKSLIVLVDSESMLKRYVNEIPDIAVKLIEASDTPLTIIYPRSKNLAAGVSETDGSVGIRVCNDKFCNTLITRFRKPIVSTSANISGEPSPSNFSEISEAVINSADYIVKYKQEDRQKHKNSPVIKIEQSGIIKIIRK